MTKLLFDTHPLVIIPELAKAIGLDEAIVIQQVHYWIEKNKAKNNNFYDGHYWCYNTYEDWQRDNFPFWCLKKVRTVFNRLRKKELIIVGNYNKLKIDRTLWYTIDYMKLSSLEPMCPKWTHGMPKMDTPLPETTTDIQYKAENKKLINSKIKTKVRLPNGMTAILQVPKEQELSIDQVSEDAETLKQLFELGIIDSVTGKYKVD